MYDFVVLAVKVVRNSVIDYLYLPMASMFFALGGAKWNCILQHDTHTAQRSIHRREPLLWCFEYECAGGEADN